MVSMHRLTRKRPRGLPQMNAFVRKKATGQPTAAPSVGSLSSAPEINFHK